MELARIWEVIRRRKWVVIQALIVVTLVAVIGSYLIRPSYEASSKILIMSETSLELSKMVEPDEASNFETASSEKRMRSNLYRLLPKQLLRTPHVLCISEANTISM